MVTRPRNLPQADPYFDSVVLLAPFSGEDGDTTTSDLSNSAHTSFTWNGTSVLDGDIRRYGFTSLQLDGDSDYVEVPHSADWAFGTGDFTIECDVRFNALPNTEASGMVMLAHYLNTGNDRSWFFNFETNDELKFWWSVNGISLQTLESTTTPTLSTNTWYHVAACRDGNNIRIFFDGAVIGSSTDITGDDLHDSARPLDIGRVNSAGFSSRFFNGWIENVRITKGVARYTGAFTPPARAHPTVQSVGSDPYFSSVTLLLPLDGADAATTTSDLSNEAHTITFNANAQLDTAQAKFGASSALFDGTGDYISVPDATSLSPIAENFTVECHVRFNGDPTTGQHTFVGKWVNGTGGNNKEWWIGYRNNELNGFLSSTGSNGIFITDVAWDPAGDTWYHIAWVWDRDEATDVTRVFVDGVQVGSDDSTLNTYATIPNGNADVWIGGYDDDANDWMDGWIDNVRITKGVARYKANFTPPAAPYPVS